MKRFFVFFTVPLMLLLGMVSCSNDDLPDSQSQPEPAENGYCLLFYASGGDPEHDLSEMNSITQAAQATAGRQDIAITALFKASGKSEGEAHNGIRRYTGEDGKLIQDTDFAPDDDFSIIDPARLTDFIRWSAQQYPDRKYLLVFTGHGLEFIPYLDIPAVKTRSTLSDGDDMMSSYHLAQGICDAGIPLEAMIAHSCLQGSIEMLAEWEGLADYLLGSPFSIPDFAYDYASLLEDLSEGRTVEDALIRTAHRTMNLWQEFHDNQSNGTVVEVSHLKELTPLWDVLQETITLMRSTLQEKNTHSTDLPAVWGETYKKGYQRAFKAMYQHNEDNFFDNFRADYAIDLPDFLRNACLYSGNVQLVPYLNRLHEALEDVLVCHLQSDGLHNHIYNVCAGYLAIPEELATYRTCRFDQLTGWSKLHEDLLGTKQE